MSLETFARQYVATMLWSSTDESTPQGGEPLDKNYDSCDIAPEAMEKIKADCTAFYNAHHLTWFDELTAIPDLDEDGRAGHDFWLTRNGHGAGFWDGDWTEPAATLLTTASKAFGECHPYIGDDGLIYLYEG